MSEIVVNPPVDEPAPTSTPAQDLRAWADERSASTKTVAEEYAQPGRGTRCGACNDCCSRLPQWCERWGPPPEWAKKVQESERLKAVAYNGPASTPAQDLRAWADQRAASTKTASASWPENDPKYDCPTCGAHINQHHADGCTTHAARKAEWERNYATNETLDRLYQRPNAGWVLEADKQLACLYRNNPIVSVCLKEWIYGSISMERALREAVVALAKQNSLLQRDLITAHERQPVVYLVPPKP